MKSIVPSFLSADFSKLKSEIRAVEKGGAERFHLDVMDGNFVPNLTFGPIIVEAIDKLTDAHLETHLMINSPMKYIDQFVEAGSDTIIIQVEASCDVRRDLDTIKSYGIKAGIVINPDTKFRKIEPYLDMIDHLLIMTVHPGFGGQDLIEESLEKVKKAKAHSLKHDFLIEIDGGINLSTIDLGIEAGADLFVSGSAVFNGDNVEGNYKKLSDRLPE